MGPVLLFPSRLWFYFLRDSHGTGSGRKYGQQGVKELDRTRLTAKHRCSVELFAFFFFFRFATSLFSFLFFSLALIFFREAALLARGLYHWAGWLTQNGRAFAYRRFACAHVPMCQVCAKRVAPVRLAWHIGRQVHKVHKHTT